MNQSTPPKSRDFSLQPPYDSDLLTLKNLLSPYTKRAYFVGGCVRDFFVGRRSDDFDIEIYDVDEERFAELMDRLGAVKAGKSFHVYKWRAFDLALPRTETKTGRGHTAFSTKLATDEKEASMRRDFTMNALMLNIFSLELLDFWGGIEDLKAGILRLIDPGKFAEDSLRVLRAMQFAARFGFRVDERTITVCREISLDDLSKERIYGEFEKLFLADQQLFGLCYGIRLGIFEKLFGLHIGFADFIGIAKELKRGDKTVASGLKSYLFLYVLKNRLHCKLEPILVAMHAPNRYYKVLEKQKRRPRNISKRFLKALSLSYPIKEWLGVNPKIIRLAKTINVYETPFEHGVDIQAVIRDGYEKAAIRKEYKRRVCRILGLEAKY